MVCERREGGRVGRREGGRVNRAIRDFHKSYVNIDATQS